MARLGGTIMRAVSTRGSLYPSLRRAYGNYEEFDVFAGADSAQKIRIDGYNERGFVANGVNFEGGVMLLSTLALAWTPKTFEEITPESLSIFQLLRPAPEILVLGCGKRMGRVSKELRDFLRSNGIKLEAIDTVFGTGQPSCFSGPAIGPLKANAASTFNILNEEGRQVAAAMVPQGAP